jgi:thymidylate kinase
MVPASSHPRPFLLISGIPGSGKTTLAHQLAAALTLPVIDKDDILERLFESKGVGDAAWRRALSRESDKILVKEAEASSGAVLVSFWRVPGMSPQSGTPIGWLASLHGCVVNIHCSCDPQVAARRFLQRKRHPGHLDGERSYPKVAASFRELALLAPPEIRMRIGVDTTQEPNIADLVREARNALYPKAKA